MAGKRKTGTVMRVEGATCLVRLGDGPAEPVRAEVRRALRWEANGASPAGAALPPSGERPKRLAAGDRVIVATDGGEPVVLGVFPRRTKLARRAAGEKSRREQVVAANVDRLAIVVAARDPEWRPGLVDRLLVAAEKGGIEPVIALNKIDLVRAEERAALERELDVYRGLGYRALVTSARTGDGVADLGDAMRGRTTVLAGPSGAGKSSLLNAVEPGLALRTGEVSEATGKGRHTTTQISLLPLRDGGFVLDTPGIREFGFYDVDATELPWLFREFLPLRARCRFPDCAHTVEPGCAVRAAAEAGEISPRRYESYLRIRESLEQEG